MKAFAALILCLVPPVAGASSICQTLPNGTTICRDTGNGGSICRTLPNGTTICR